MAKIFLDVRIVGWDRYVYDESQLPQILEAIATKGPLPEMDEIIPLLEHNETVYNDEVYNEVIPKHFEITRYVDNKEQVSPVNLVLYSVSRTSEVNAGDMLDFLEGIRQTQTTTTKGRIDRMIAAFNEHTENTGAELGFDWPVELWKMELLLMVNEEQLKTVRQHIVGELNFF